MNILQRALFPTLLIFLFFLSGISASAHTLDLHSGKVVSLDTMIDDLLQSRVVFIGELHDRPAHHLAQLQIIQALHNRGAKIAVAMEMFRHDSQQALNEWVDGSLNEQEFLPVYLDNWSMWPLYRPIFIFARNVQIPMVGLNLDRRITSQVARSGFDSLTPQERGEVPKVQCDVNPAYQEFIRKMLGEHVHAMSDVSFMNFCEAQMVWDEVMADNLIDYLQNHPKTIVVVLAGSGHAWKYGIPEQLKRKGETNFRVILPEVPERIDEQHVGPHEADYLLQGVDLGPIH